MSALSTKVALRAANMTMANRRAMLSRNAAVAHRNFSTSEEKEAPPSSSGSMAAPTPTPVSFTRLVYEGRYWKALRRIRRVSLGSCLTGLIVVPIGLIEHSETLSQTGQAAIMGVTILTTVGSTLGLHYLSHTYVSKMYAPEKTNGEEYEVERLNIYGNTTARERIRLSRIAKTTAFDHPFSNFAQPELCECCLGKATGSCTCNAPVPAGQKKKGPFYYVSTPAIADAVVQQKFDDALQ